MAVPFGLGGLAGLAFSGGKKKEVPPLNPNTPGAMAARANAGAAAVAGRGARSLSV